MWEARPTCAARTNGDKCSAYVSSGLASCTRAVLAPRRIHLPAKRHPSRSPAGAGSGRSPSCSRRARSREPCAEQGRVSRAEQNDHGARSRTTPRPHGTRGPERTRRSCSGLQVYIPAPPHPPPPPPRPPRLPDAAVSRLRRGHARRARRARARSPVRRSASSPSPPPLPSCPVLSLPPRRGGGATETRARGSRPACVGAFTTRTSPPPPKKKKQVATQPPCSARA